MRVIVKQLSCSANSQINQYASTKDGNPTMKDEPADIPAPVMVKVPRSHKRQHMTPAEATAAGLFPRSILRRAFRLKPSVKQEPAGTVWQGHGHYHVFDKILCTPLRPYCKPSPAQLAALAAGRNMTRRAVCCSCSRTFSLDELANGKCPDCNKEEQAQLRRIAIHEARLVALQWLDRDPVFLDTETTGLDGNDQICEIAILSVAGEVLFTSLILPCCQMNPDAAAVHGITDQDLAQAPAWPGVYQRVKGILDRRLVIAHNADFDARLLAQTCHAYGLEAPQSDWGCTMKVLAPVNGWHRLHLAEAVAITRAVPSEEPAHRAVRDADTVRRVVLALVGPAC